MIRNHQDSSAPYPGFSREGDAATDSKEGRSEKGGQGRGSWRRFGKRGQEDRRTAAGRGNDETREAERLRKALPKKRYLTALARSEQAAAAFRLEPLDPDVKDQLFSPSLVERDGQAEAASILENVAASLAERRSSLERLPRLSCWVQSWLHDMNLKAAAITTFSRQCRSVFRVRDKSEPDRARLLQNRRAEFERGKADFLIAMFSFQLLGMGMGAVAGIMPLSFREAVLGGLIATLLAGGTLMLSFLLEERPVIEKHNQQHQRKRRHVGARSAGH